MFLKNILIRNHEIFWNKLACQMPYLFIYFICGGQHKSTHGDKIFFGEFGKKPLKNNA